MWDRCETDVRPMWWARCGKRLSPDPPIQLNWLYQLHVAARQAGDPFLTLTTWPWACPAGMPVAMSMSLAMPMGLWTHARGFAHGHVHGRALMGMPLGMPIGMPTGGMSQAEAWPGACSWACQQLNVIGGSLEGCRVSWESVRRLMDSLGIQNSPEGLKDSSGTL